MPTSRCAPLPKGSVPSQTPASCWGTKHEPVKTFLIQIITRIQSSISQSTSYHLSSWIFLLLQRYIVFSPLFVLFFFQVLPISLLNASCPILFHLGSYTSIATPIFFIMCVYSFRNQLSHVLLNMPESFPKSPLSSCSNSCGSSVLPLSLLTSFSVKHLDMLQTNYTRCLPILMYPSQYMSTVLVEKSVP